LKKHFYQNEFEHYAPSEEVYSRIENYERQIEERVSYLENRIHSNDRYEDQESEQEDQRAIISQDMYKRTNTDGSQRKSEASSSISMSGPDHPNRSQILNRSKLTDSKRSDNSVIKHVAIR